MRRIYILLICTVLSTNALGQLHFSELYQYNMNFVHPGFVGQDGTKILARHRLEKYPQHMYNNNNHVHMTGGFEHKAKKIKSGFGLNVNSTDYGTASVTGYLFSYNYQINLNDDLTLLPSLSWESNLRKGYFEYADNDLYKNEFVTRSRLNLGVMAKSKKLFGGVLLQDFLLSGPGLPQRGIVGLFGISLAPKTNFDTKHSIYVHVTPDDTTYDLNNRIIYDSKWIVDVSALYLSTDDSLCPRVSAGFRWNDYLTVGTLLYSSLQHQTNRNFTTETYLEFRF